MKVLTVEILKGLAFSQTLHLNGGDQYSTTVRENAEFGLSITTHTDGSPNYRVTEKTLFMNQFRGVQLDLLSPKKDLQAFCDAYNEAMKGGGA